MLLDLVQSLLWGGISREIAWISIVCPDRAIYKVIALFMSSFAPLALQAYVFDLDDEYSESDIPTTLIRSKADCPTVEVPTFQVACVSSFKY